MNLHDFTHALRRLSTTEVGGAKEAAAFFAVALGNGLSKDVIEFTDNRPGATRTRLSMLSLKGLIERKKSPRGKSIYVLTAKGRKLLTTVLPTTTTK